MKEKEKHNVKFLPITELEKADLKNKIFNSVHENKSRKYRIRYAFAIAASITLLLTVSFYSYTTPTESIIDFVNSSDHIDINDSKEVILVLGEGENLKIDEKVTEINYSSTGEQVKIGHSKIIDQQTYKNNKLVYNTFLVPYGRRSKIQLSDGSIVWLNSGSKLVYPAVFKGGKREIYLEGEAIFDVAHNKSKPFIVISQNQEIEVLGTVFGVTSYLDEKTINTVLKSGSVQISYHNDASSPMTSDKMKISPGTIASYNKTNKGIVSEKVNVDNYFSWRDGVLVFKNNDLQFIMKRLSRYYNIDIEISDDIIANDRETFSGYLDLNEDMNQVIKNIQMSANMKYMFTENKLIIN
ncbi:MAG: transmembrane sensor [Patiriisocius sp.]|jgi:transmembrane sensor